MIRRRDAPDVIDTLVRLAWWDWPIDHILTHEAAICGGDIDALMAATPQG